VLQCVHWVCQVTNFLNVPRVQQLLVYTHSHTRLMALCLGLPGRKVQPIWILLKQETVSGSGISWAICKSADSHTSIPPLSFLQAGGPSCHPTNSIKALKAKTVSIHLVVIQTLTFIWCVVKNRTALEPRPRDPPLPATRSGTCTWNWSPDITFIQNGSCQIFSQDNDNEHKNDSISIHIEITGNFIENLGLPFLGFLSHDSCDKQGDQQKSMIKSRGGFQLQHR